jgi:2-polyprenyl-3-methyl-5-hydroxy-6-metoxy-1,4-benzoquinol methylase
MIKLDRNEWNEIFKNKGKVFTEPQEDIPKIVRIFKKQNVKKVLDLGCGSGRHLIFLNKQGFEVYGIDIAKSGIGISKKWLRKEGLKANLKVGNIYRKLPYKTNFFDAIISTQTLHHDKIENIRKLIKEIERILKPNGLIFVTVLRFFLKKQMKLIAPRTYINATINDRDVPHYKFTENTLRKEFKNFKILDLWIEQSGMHYCLLGKKK